MPVILLLLLLKGAAAGRQWRRLAGAAAVLLLATAPPPLAAQEEPSGTTYITPFPEGDTYKLQAYGDAFAEGLLTGLVEALAGDTRVQVPRRHRALTGLARTEFEDELKAEEANRDTVHIGVVMIGVYDRTSIRMAARERLVLGSDEWKEEYGRRVDRLIKTLKRRGVAVYWVGQPIMRRYEVNDPAQMMNDIVREKVYLNGAKYIDIQAQFADEAGNYSAYGPDLTGKQRLLREADGVLFTAAGNRKLAHFIEQELKRDLTQARNERSIPLAGAEAEQKRVSALRPPEPAAAGGTPAKSTGAAAQKDAKSWHTKTTSSPQAQPADSSGEQKADNGRITLKTTGAGGREEAVTLELPRPAIPSAVLALITRKELSDKPSQVGDAVAEDVGGGLVVLSSITPSAGPGGGINRRVSPSQTPYYRVLIKGERPQPKPGRADDFSWPKAEPEVAVEPAAPQQRLPRPARTPPRS